MRTHGKEILLAHIYVVDNIFGFTNKSLCDQFVNLMQREFKMSMIGELTYFIGLQIR